MKRRKKRNQDYNVGGGEINEDLNQTMTDIGSTSYVTTTQKSLKFKNDAFSDGSDMTKSGTKSKRKA